MSALNRIMLSTGINYMALSLVKLLLSQIGYEWILEGPNLGEDVYFDFVLCASLGLALSNELPSISDENKKDKPIIITGYTDERNNKNPQTNP